MNKLSRSLSFIRRFGIKQFSREIFYRVSNRYCDRYFNVSTRRMTSISDVGVVDPNSKGSYPATYSAIFSALKHVPMDFSRCTFLDYGAGKGRAVVAAAAFPFRKVIGVELSPQVLEIARNNVGRMRHKKARSIELVHANAAHFSPPRDVNLIYFYNPFNGQTLDRVIDNIQASYRNSPRMIYIIYLNDTHFHQKVADLDWIDQVCRGDVAEYRYGIYRIGAGREAMTSSGGDEFSRSQSGGWRFST